MAILTFTSLLYALISHLRWALVLFKPSTLGPIINRHIIAPIYRDKTYSLEMSHTPLPLASPSPRHTLALALCC